MATKAKTGRKRLTLDEVKVLALAVTSSISRDFLKKEVSYQEAGDMKYVAGYQNQTDQALKTARTILRDEFNASMVAVGNGKVAVVKRPVS